MLFKNEFGDLIAWRAALAGTAVVSASAALAVALFGGVPAGPEAASGPEAVLWEYDAEGGGGGPQEPPQTPTTASEGPVVATAAEPPSDQAHAWLAGTEDSALWASLTPDATDALRDAVTTWAGANGMADATSFALESAEATPEATVVRLRVEGPGRAASLAATLAPGGAWQVTDATGTPEPSAPEPSAPDPASPVPVADVAQLSRLTGGHVAGEVARQVAASGLPGAEGAWTTAESVAHEGALWRLTLWMPTGDAGSARYDAAFDEGLGLLQLAPAIEGVA